MPTVEQTVVINAPAEIVMDALNDVETIPDWATVSGTINNVQGQGPGMTYQWRYSINKLSFGGHSEVLEQTETSLVTKTTGDIDSLWTIELIPISKNSTSMNVVVEYMPPNIFVDVLANLVMQQMGDPAVARDNAARFKASVEARVKAAEEQTVANN